MSYSSADYFARSDPFLTAALMQPAPFSNLPAGALVPAALNGASFAPVVSPGEWASVFGNFIGADTATVTIWVE